jgi:hypothetical protein
MAIEFSNTAEDALTGVAINEFFESWFCRFKPFQFHVGVAVISCTSMVGIFSRPTSGQFYLYIYVSSAYALLKAHTGQACDG